MVKNSDICVTVQMLFLKKNISSSLSLSEEFLLLREVADERELPYLKLWWHDCLVTRQERI